MKLDWGFIVKGLMGPVEIVLNEPVSQAPVENLAISSHIAQGNKFIFQGAVEPLVKSVVFWGFRPRIITADLKFFDGFRELALKFAAVVPGQILDFLVEKIIQSSEEIFGILGMLALIHPRKGDL